MSKSAQGQRNSLAEFLWKADPNATPQKIASKRKRFRCPACGYTAELHRNSCMVCSYNRPLQPIRGHERRDEQ